MNLEIRIIGDPVLRKKATEVEKFDDELKSIVEEMLPKMYRWDGVGLAAPQVGISKRFFVCDDGETQRVVINPVIKEFLGEDVEIEEGCLSIPGIYSEIKRPEGVKVEYKDPEGNVIEEEIHGYAARIFQHEFDHLDGILFADKLSVVAKARLKKEINLLIKDGRKKAKELGEITL
ncbi:MAG TPA: peptide deformylase [Tepiditoga sp.]|nr:peptide deformylase [Tepiditoga sp.]